MSIDLAFSAVSLPRQSIGISIDHQLTAGSYHMLN